MHLRQAVVARLLAQLEAAQLIGSARVAVTLGPRIFELRATRGRGRYILTNADLVVVLEVGAAEGWCVQVEFSGARMAQTPLRAATLAACELAKLLGTIEAIRIRRLDLCADVEHLDLNALEGLAWVKPRRAKLASVSTDALEKVYEPGRRTYERGGRVTGVAICPGNCLMLLAYDKREELNALPDDRKRTFEEGIWREAGWDGTASIARVEFRFRSEALKELCARDDIHRLEKNLDRLWQYACRKWVRLVERSSAAKLSNCRVAEAWDAIQRHVFRHRSGASPRMRLRGGATSTMVFGTALSRLAATQSLPPPENFINAFGAPQNDAEGLSACSREEVRWILRDEVRRVLDQAASTIADDFEERFRSVHKATLFVRNRTRAAGARFWIGDDQWQQQASTG